MCCGARPLESAFNLAWSFYRISHKNTINRVLVIEKLQLKHLKVFRRYVFDLFHAGHLENNRRR